MTQDKDNQGRRPRWPFPAGALVVAGLAICAAQLLMPGGSDALRGFLDGAGALTGVFLAYAAVVILAGLIWPQDGGGLFDFVAKLIYGELALLFAGIAMLGLGAISLVSPAPAPFAVLLVIPGWYALALVGANEKREKAIAAERARAGVESQSGSAWSALAVFVEGLAALGVLMTVFFRIFYALIAELTQGTPVPLENLSAELSQFGLYWDVVVPMLFSVIVALGTLGALAFAAVWIWRQFNTSQDRALTSEETRYVEAAVETLREYGKAENFARYEWLRWVQLSVFMTLMLSGFAAILFGYRILAGIAESARTPMDAAWFVYEAENMGIGGLIAAFALILVIVVPFALAYRIWPRAAEALTWIEFASGRMPFGADLFLRSWLRSGRISVAQKFDPGKFLRDASKAYEPYFLWPAVVLVPLTGYILTLDLADYDLITPDRIVTVDYWTSQPRTHRHEDIEAVIAECVYDDGDPDGEIELRMASGDQIAVDVRPGDHERLDALTEIDDRLRARGVKVEFALRTPMFRDAFVAYREDCVADLVDGLPPERAAQIERILHLDDWRGRK